MADVKVEHKSTMTRHEASRWIADVAEALAANGPVKLRLGGGTVEIEVPDKVRCEAEVEVDGDEIELELKWSTARQDAAVPKATAPKKSVAGG
jgi:amphi-Trp domain-containing protein